jgi:hypothetical protein
MAASITDTTVDTFLDLMNQFLGALEEVFPECLKVKQYKMALSARLTLCLTPDSRLNVGKEAIHAFHDNMHLFYSRVIEKDDSLLYEDIELVHSIDLAAKWTPELHAETKDAIWEYIQKLCEQSNIHSMYSRVPSGMMSSIESMAHTIASQINQGEMSLGELNIQQVSQQVLSSLNADDLQTFAENLRGSDMLENVTNMYSMMSSMLRSQQM